MDNNENVVVETTENVDVQATEELVDGSSVATDTLGSEQNATNAEEKLYTQADIDRLVNEKVDELLPRKLERAKSKLQREYQERYGRTETVLNAGLGTTNIDDATKKLSDFYKAKGIVIPDEPRYSEADLKVLANAEANEIINSSYEDLVEEVDRLADKGIDRMTAREKLVFTKLAEERKRQESVRDLAQIGVKPEALNDSDYLEFANKLNPSLSAKEKYEMYLKIKPKPKVETIGSMKGATSKDNGVKDFYTYEESLKFTKADFDRNPELYKAVEKSMQKW
jgi:hypothetical protein